MKECGGCTWCCYFMESKELNMGVGDWCRECVVDVGCQIHETRPQVCRGFDCTWKAEDLVPESFRPDKIGVVFELPNVCSVYVGHVLPTMPDALETDEVKVFVTKIIESGHSVVLCKVDGTKIYALAKDDTLEGIKKELEDSYNAHKENGII